MAQAHRIKTDPSAIRTGILRFLNRILRESGFWLLAAVALGMIAALATFSPVDPAWTHTVSVARWHNLGGVIGAWFADMSLYFFGYPAYLLPLGIVFGGWRLFRCGRLLELDGEIIMFRVLGFTVALATAGGLAALHLRVMPGSLPSGGTAGGLVGIHIGRFLTSAFGFTGGNLFMAGLLLAGVMLATGASWLTILDWIGTGTLKLLDSVGGLALAPLRWLGPVVKGTAAVPESAPDPDADPAGQTALERLSLFVSGPSRAAIAKASAWWSARRGVAEPPDSGTTATPLDEELTVLPSGRPGRIEPVLNWPGAEGGPSSPAEISHGSGEVALEAPSLDLLTLVPTAPLATPAPLIPERPSVQTPWQPGEGFPANPRVPPQRPIRPRLPPLDLLDCPPPRPDGDTPETLRDLARQVEIQLKRFGIEVKVAAVERGPVITRFEIEPASGVNASQISALAKELARGLRVVSVRVVGIIPGKTAIGLEIPHRQPEIVSLREVLESPVYVQAASPLTLVLGKEGGGHPVVANLNRMPHLLIAGTTGSGQSVAMNAMLLSLVYKALPGEVRLILVDSSRREWSMYEDIPHLLTPVITDMKQAANALHWCVGEMERRYHLMVALKVRHIAGFNRKVLDALASGEGLTDPFGTPGNIRPLPPLPFIVVVMGELAELMMIVGKPVEELITRLAQKAQAAGIHLILATQRPSVDVITGLIKANIPTRIAFQVSSGVDSHTILDQMGAEELLGDGDMLYLPPGGECPQRIHGALVGDHEIKRVVDYLRQSGAPDPVDEVLARPGEASAWS